MDLKWVVEIESLFSRPPPLVPKFPVHSTLIYSLSI
jgi:hypothetical protein